MISLCLPSNHTTAGNSRERDEESLRLRNGFLASDMEFEQETSRFCDSNPGVRHCMVGGASREVWGQMINELLGGGR